MAGGRTHRPEHDEGRCSACAGCSWRCPAAVLPPLRNEQGSLRGALFAKDAYPGRPRSAPPCVLACPLGQDVPTYVSALARDDAATAARVIRETNALPAVCGRLCNASCMRACTREGIDDGIDIRALKRYAVETAEAPSPSTAGGGADPTVAVVGAGPAGLAAAHRLIQLGLGVEIFEAAPLAGGLLADVVPGFVLPAKQLLTDIAVLERQGVAIRTGTRVGVDVPWSELADKHSAVLVTTGAARGMRPGLPGRDLQGVTEVVAFCRTVRRDLDSGLAAPIGAGSSVVVIGGGKPALLAARVARRLGAEAIVAHPAPLDRWPAGADAIEHAVEEGVELRAAHRLTGLEGEQGRLTAVVLQPVVAGPPDAVGRAPLRNRGSAEPLAAAMLVAAVDRAPTASALPDIDGLERGVRGNLNVDGQYRLGPAGWYAAGEVATGAASLVDSMATGRRAANEIAADLMTGNGGGAR